MSQEEEILKKGTKRVLEAYKNALDPTFDLENKLDEIEIKINKDLQTLAYSNTAYQIQLKSIREIEDENILLTIHEILHILFTNSMIHQMTQKLIDKKRVRIEDKFLQALLDMFIDIQTNLFTGYGPSVWTNLNKPLEGKYFTDESMEYMANEFIEEKEIDKKLVNLEVLLKEFLEENMPLILAEHSEPVEIPKHIKVG